MCRVFPSIVKLSLVANIIEFIKHNNFTMAQELLHASVNNYLIKIFQCKTPNFERIMK
jgi:hypothetical protein